MDHAILEAIQWLENGGAFFAEQAPLFVQELLLWKIASASTQLGLATVLFVAVLLGRQRRRARQSEVTRSRWDLGALAATAALVLYGLPASKALAYVLIAPRLVVVDELQSLLRGF